MKPFEKLQTLVKHLDAIANYCRTEVRIGVAEAVNGNIRMPINRKSGYKNIRYRQRKKSANEPFCRTPTAHITVVHGIYWTWNIDRRSFWKVPRWLAP